jgi:hypothetical protein
MNNPLVEKIQEIVKNSPEMKQLKYDRISSVVGVVQEVKPGISKTPIASVKYTDPRDGARKIQWAEIGTVGGFNQQLSSGDIVMVSFALEHYQHPTIISKYTVPGIVTTITGSSTTTISQGW